MASIKQYKTKDGETRYSVRVYVGRDPLTNQKRYMHKRGFKQKKEATLAASRLTLDADKGDLPAAKQMLFIDLYKEWDAGYINTVRESTYARTTRIFTGHILPVFANIRLSEITAARLQLAVNKWSKEVTSYRRWFNYLVKALNFAVIQGYIPHNPARKVVMPKRSDTAGDKPENFWDRDELATFFSYINPETEPEKLALFRILAFGGLRRGECLALTWADIDFTAGTIRVNKTLTQGMKGRQIIQAPKTRKGRRTIAMDPETMAIIKKWRIKQMQKFVAVGINTNRPEQGLFVTIHNTQMYLNQPEKWLKAIERDHNIKHRITVHGFRHSHASALFAAGADIKEVQNRLGHENVQTTLDIYTHVTENQKEQAAEKLSAYLGF
ncbi:tyrosine-type recombinase/integrase [Schleiferilactobacillus perolens]|jgi:integrase|uniref:site-specific integrase n=1 Tax=Schleiferilactobacillus perolens TaxID=100468 RepID=UPI002357AE15|nr:tyrosine-type recombinase/integrase [Schleiferilactobacillus perolens]MCI2170715.1 site-specific integrase [Schleiferilactobacillus perolens]